MLVDDKDADGNFFSTNLGVESSKSEEMRPALPSWNKKSVEFITFQTSHSKDEHAKRNVVN